MALGLIHPITEMSTRDVSWVLRQLVHRVDNFATFLCQLSRNFGSLNLLEPLGPVQACVRVACRINLTIISRLDTLALNDRVINE